MLASINARVAIGRDARLGRARVFRDGVSQAFSFRCKLRLRLCHFIFALREWGLLQNHQHFQLVCLAMHIT